MRGQSVLGEEDYADRLVEYLRGQRDIKEIPKRQRFLNRPGLDELFENRGRRDRSKRNEIMLKAVMEHGYSQKEIAAHLGLHYSTVSRLLGAIKQTAK